MLRSAPLSQLRVRAQSATNERWRCTNIEDRRRDRYLRAATAVRWYTRRSEAQALTHAPCDLCGEGTSQPCDGCLFRGQEIGEVNPVPWAVCSTCDTAGFVCRECSGYGYTREQTASLMQQRFPGVASGRQFLVTCLGNRRWDRMARQAPPL